MAFMFAEHAQLANELVVFCAKEVEDFCLMLGAILVLGGVSKMP
jgi:hypothetical protein